MTVQASTIFALRFISGKYQGGELPLHPGREIIIGRSSDLDMVLVEDMVSRKHAKITTSAEQIHIQDLGSTNGTFVNGEKIKKSQLQEGDRILIGTSIIKLVTSNQNTTDADQVVVGKEPASPKRTVAATRAMAGTIDEVQLPDLLQLLSTSRKSGILALCHDEEEGKLYIRNGQIFFAKLGEGQEQIKPRKAIYRMLTWVTGTFELLPAGEETFEEELQDSIEGLLMEAMRQLDEMNVLKDAGRLPPRTAKLGLTFPLETPLRDLTPEQLDMVQIVHNHPTVGGVLDHLPENDLDVSQRIADLIKAKVVAPSED